MRHETLKNVERKATQNRVAEANNAIAIACERKEMSPSFFRLLDATRKTQPTAKAAAEVARIACTAQASASKYWAYDTVLWLIATAKDTSAKSVHITLRK